MVTFATFAPFIAEYLGTALFATVILKTGQAIPIGAALASVIYAFGGASGGHFNPAVSTVAVIDQKITPFQYPFYLITQIAGALTAYGWFKITESKDDVLLQSTVEM